VPHRLGPQLTLERLDAAARPHGPPAQDHRSIAFAHAILQSKARGGVNSMPTLRLHTAGPLPL
jgi:hypothetical protein